METPHQEALPVSLHDILLDTAHCGHDRMDKAELDELGEEAAQPGSRHVGGEGEEDFRALLAHADHDLNCAAELYALEAHASQGLYSILERYARSPEDVLYVFHSPEK